MGGYISPHCDMNHTVIVLNVTASPWFSLHASDKYCTTVLIYKAEKSFANQSMRLGFPFPSHPSIPSSKCGALSRIMGKWWEGFPRFICGDRMGMSSSVIIRHPITGCMFYRGWTDYNPPPYQDHAVPKDIQGSWWPTSTFTKQHQLFSEIPSN